MLLGPFAEVSGGESIAPQISQRAGFLTVANLFCCNMLFLKLFVILAVNCFPLAALATRPEVTFPSSLGLIRRALTLYLELEENIILGKPTDVTRFLVWRIIYVHSSYLLARKGQMGNCGNGEFQTHMVLSP